MTSAIPVQCSVSTEIAALHRIKCLVPSDVMISVYNTYVLPHNMAENTTECANHSVIEPG